MAAKTADEWCDSMLIIDDERRKFFRGCWGAATEAAKEKFNSAPAANQQLKAAIALVREAAVLHIIGMGGYSEFMCGLDDIEQRAAV